MAATTISHNKPTAGSISWTAFNIAYDGANFTIPAGNTAAKFVWWVYNGGAPRLMTGDVLPDLTADDTVLFLNKQGVGQLLPESTVVDGSLIVEESIYAQAIASDQIVSRHIVSDAITTDHLAANSVTAEQLSVGTVSANLVSNGSFEDIDDLGRVIGWEALQAQGGTMAPVTGVSSSGAVAVMFDLTATTGILRLSQKPDQFIPVSNASSRRWYISARMGVGTAITKGAYLRAVWYDANKYRLTSGDYIDVGRSNAALTTTFTVYEGQVTPPAAARYMAIEVILTAPNVPTKMYVDEVTVSEVVVSAVIADGAITANKVAAKAITADKLTISDSTNLLTDPSLSAGGSGWNIGGAATIVTVPAAEIRPGSVGTKALQFTGSGVLRELATDSLPAEAGEWYYASCWVRATATTASTGTVELASTVKTTTSSTWPSFQQVAANTITTSWRLLEGKIKLPANTQSFALRPAVRDNVTSGTFQFTDFVLRRMNGGELIVDGAIKTDHMTANTISGDVIAANTLVGTKLMADSITSRELVAHEIWANSAWITAIEGKRIIGASIETNSGANTGLKMTGAGLVGYNASGTESLRLDGVNNVITGELAHARTQSDGKVYETRLGTTTTTRFSNTAKSVPGLEFGVKHNAGQAPAGYSPAKIMNAGSNLVITSGRPGGDASDPGISQIELRDGGIYLGAEKGGSIYAHGRVYAAEAGENGYRRLPYGQLHVWKSSNQINLTNNTLLMEASVFVPSYAVLKISLHLRGYPNVANQLFQVSLKADNAPVGDHVHYSPIAWSATDGMAFWTYTNPGAGKRVTFRITGTTVVPGVGTTTFIIPAVAAGGAASTEVLIEDIGSTVQAAIPLNAVSFYG